MIKKHIFYCIIVLITMGKLSSQTMDEVNYSTIDSATYTDYTNHQWENVLEIGSKGIKNNIDYYYLRMRMGISEYNLKNYTLASAHFKKALKFYDKDQTAQLYLYDTYLAIGKNSQAIKLSNDFSNTTLKSLTTKPRNPIGINAGAGYSFTNNFALNDNFTLNADSDTAKGIKVLIGNKAIGYGGASFHITPSISSYVGFTHLEIQKRSIFQYSQYPLIEDSTNYFDWGYQNYYSIDSSIRREAANNTIKQNELYLNLRFQFSESWAATVYGNLIFVNTVNFISVEDQKSINRIAYQVNGEQPQYFTYNYDELQFVSRDSTLTNYVVGVNIEKDFCLVTLNLNANMSALNAANQNQIGLSAYYYLNSRATFYGITDATWFNQRWRTGISENRLLLHQKIGGKIIGNLWGGLDFYYGNLNNANIDNGSVVYNQVDDLNYKGGINLKMFVGKHFELILLYSYSSYNGNFIEFGTHEDQTDVMPIQFNYETQNIVGGIKWKL